MNRESERKRLVELIRCGVNKHESNIENYVFPIWEFIADHLLDNGVVVPPVKVGDKVWALVYGNEIHEYKIIRMVPAEEFISYSVVRKNGNLLGFSGYDIGKEVFLTREEAEARLKGGEQK